LSLDLTKYNVNKKPKSSEKEEGNSRIWDILNKDISLSRSGFNDKKKEQFYTDMSILLEAGLDLNASLRLLDEENAQQKGENIYTILLKDVLSGLSLSKSMENTKKFSNYEYQSIRIGEETGRLAIILKELKKHYEQKNALRQQFIGMITYPIIVIVIAVGVLIFLMNYVVPMFMSFLTQVNAELPWITTFVLQLSNLVSFWYPYFLGLMLIIVLFIYFQKDQLWFKKVFSQMLLKIPLFGKMSQRIYLSRFCQAMTLLMTAKVPLIDALEMTKNMVDFYPLESSIDNIKSKILKGQSMHVAMTKESIFEPRMISMVRVGEEVNKLDEVFGKLTVQYSDNVENQTKVIKSILEPALLIIVGSVVALVALAMILPIFKMSSSMEF
jgi:type IV pilus assembly protein PilC